MLQLSLCRGARLYVVAAEFECVRRGQHYSDWKKTGRNVFVDAERLVHADAAFFKGDVIVLLG